MLQSSIQYPRASFVRRAALLTIGDVNFQILGYGQLAMAIQAQPPNDQKNSTWVSRNCSAQRQKTSYSISCYELRVVSSCLSRFSPKTVSSQFTLIKTAVASCSVSSVVETRHERREAKVSPAKHNCKPLRPAASEIGRVAETTATWATLKTLEAIARERRSTLSSPALLGCE